MIFGTVSGKRAGVESAPRMRITPFIQKGRLMFQFTSETDGKAFHENYEPKSADERLESLLRTTYTQAMIYSEDADWHVVSAGKIKIGRKDPSKTRSGDISHDRKKRYILDEDMSHDFLVHLGIQTDEGAVRKGKKDKFRQINKYLELVEGLIPQTGGRPVRIIDFGCGKAYLTFAMYYYLKRIRGIECEITGLDLKQDVMEFCGEVAAKLGYSGLEFKTGDISGFENDRPVDMVISLHACDTATDLAIAKAVGWKAPVIVAVPCCQHELFAQLSSGESAGQNALLRNGIIKERTAALLTDSLRASLLEVYGYRTDIVEFVDMEHTPKNIMIRAKRTQKTENPAQRAEKYKEYTDCRDYWRVSPCLEQLLGDMEKTVAKGGGNYEE